MRYHEACQRAPPPPFFIPSSATAWPPTVNQRRTRIGVPLPGSAVSGDTPGRTTLDAREPSTRPLRRRATPAAVPRHCRGTNHSIAFAKTRPAHQLARSEGATTIRLARHVRPQLSWQPLGGCRRNATKWARPWRRRVGYCGVAARASGIQSQTAPSPRARHFVRAQVPNGHLARGRGSRRRVPRPTGLGRGDGRHSPAVSQP